MALTATLKETVALLLPKFGTQAVPDVPRFNPELGLYLVHHYTAASGNCYLTYVGISKELIIEVNAGLHYGVMYLNNVSASVGNGSNFKCFLADEYTVKTHLTPEQLRSDLECKLTEYVLNEQTSAGMTEKEVGAKVKSILDELFGHKPSDLDKRGTRYLLEGYCRLRNFCSEFINTNSNF